MQTCKTGSRGAKVCTIVSLKREARPCAARQRRLRLAERTRGMRSESAAGMTWWRYAPGRGFDSVEIRDACAGACSGARIPNVHRNALHQLTPDLASRFDVIGIADLNVGA